MTSRETVDKETTALQKVAVELLIRFFILMKSVKIYDSRNAICQEQAKSFFDMLDEMLKTEGETAFIIRHSSILMNRARLKFGLGNYQVLRSLLAEFKKRSIGAVRFMPGLTMEEALTFTRLFANWDRKETFSFPHFSEELEMAGVVNVILDRAMEKETFSGAERNTARIYYLSIIHLRESFERDRRMEPLKINTTRRLMQSIYNHIVDNEAFVLGMSTLKNYDEYTLNHSVNVCALAMALGRRLGLSRAELVELGIAAFFHDLGKTQTPLEILNKPGKLDAHEWEIMERHPFQGAEKLVHLKDFRRLPLRAVHVAMEHHVKEDLSGYPKYFARDRINLFSKIVKVVDYFDAITTPRVYRKAPFTRTEAMNHMLALSGTEFNPVILKVFVNLLGVFPIGSLVALDSGEAAIVLDTNPETKFILRPKVKLISDRNGNRIDGKIIDLTETDPETGRFQRSIVKALDPEAYGVNVIDYFLAEAAD